MTDTLHVNELRRNVGEALDRVNRGERLIITRFERPIAGLVSLSDLERLEANMPVAVYRATNVSVTDIVKNALTTHNNDPIAALRSIKATRRMYDLAEEQVLILALEQLGGDIATVEGRVDALTGDHK